MKRVYKRRRFLILNFQYQLLAVNVLYLLSVLLIFSAILFVPVMMGLESSSLSGNETLEAATQFLSLHARVWPAIFIVFVLLIFHSILVSDRIAGPLYRFRGFFKAISDGDLSGEVTIRKQDYLHEDAHAINQMMISLRAKITSIKGHCHEALAALNQLTRAIDSSIAKEISQNLKILELRMEQLKADMDQFRTTGEESEIKDDPANRLFSEAASGARRRSAEP